MPCEQFLKSKEKNFRRDAYRVCYFEEELQWLGGSLHSPGASSNYFIVVVVYCTVVAHNYPPYSVDLGYGVDLLEFTHLSHFRI